MRAEALDPTQPPRVSAKDATNRCQQNVGAACALANKRTKRETGIAYNIAYGLLTAKRVEIEIIERLQNGGGGRTRTCEAMRRLIYSQLPLPLGTLPRSMTVPSGRLMSRRRTCHGREGRDLRKTERCAAGRVYGRRGGAKSTKRGAKSGPSGVKNCQNPEPVTQAQG